MSDEPRLIVRHEGAVGRVIFSNPSRRNAMTMDMWRGVPTALQALDADPAIRVIVLEGAGEAAFVSGADISQFESVRIDPDTRCRYDDAVDAAYAAPLACGKPVLAKIRGICMGGGLGLAAACDIRICADDARLRMPAGRLGLGYKLDGVRRFVASSARRTRSTSSSRPASSARRTPCAWASSARWRRPSAWRTKSCNGRRRLPTTPRSRCARRSSPSMRCSLRPRRDLELVESALEACFRSEDYREGCAPS
jgi:hypothetical protein